MDGCASQRTIKYPANEISCKRSLLLKVQPGWGLWGVGVIGPRNFRRVRHGSDVWDSRSFGEGQSSKVDGRKCRESAGYKHLETGFMIDVG